jgi:hypothetical protein
MAAIDDLEIKFASQLSSCILELEREGYTEDQIVSLDFDDEGVTFLLTDGKEIKINPLVVWFT